MYKEYEELYKQYTQKYGPKTAIFLMVGSFYELYDTQNVQTGETTCNVKEIIDHLGIQLSVKKSESDENFDVLFAGFPDYVMHKWAGRLTTAGWTVVIVDQIKDVRGKVKERKVSRILSPSTHIENTSSYETPYVLTVYFEERQGIAPTFGVGALDLTTGTTTTYSGNANGRSDIWTADDLVQMMSVFQPKEILVYWRGQQMIDESIFRRIFGISQTISVHMRLVETLGSFSKELVRSEYLQKTYSIKSVLPVKTYLGIRSDNEELALLYLLQFAEEHYPSMLKSFHRNEPWIPHTKLICGNHALTQLQMTGYNVEETVIGLFNLGITPMGKRAMKERLLSPYSEADEIRSRLLEIQEFMKMSDNNQKLLERQLRFMHDLPRLHRKLLCGLILQSEISGLFQTYNAMSNIMQNIVQNTRLQQPFTLEQWAQYMSVFEHNFSLDKSLRVTNDNTPFSTDKYKEIGQIEKEISYTLNGFQQLKREIATKGGINEDSLRLEEREKEPFGIKTSTVNLQQLKKNISQLPEGSKVSELKSGGWFDCTKLQNLNTQLVKLREQLQTHAKKAMMDACQEIATAGQSIWSMMEHWISHIDCTQCIGRVSKERGFVCPNIEDVDDNGSGFDIKNIRHPLVEATASRVSYVKHDVSLGEGHAASPNPPHQIESNEVKGQGKTEQKELGPLGWLVYGMNASGKSTLMKAVGISILLAQAGCFVPAKDMTLKPFKAVYTRILNQDNLFAGLSSFAVEMSELRDILRNANKYSLVLGDELCAGTESISAQALVASGIQWLSERKAKFIFATHLHDLPELLDTKQLGVEVWHLHVDYDPYTKKLVYDRTLRPGSGSTLYGLEVARAMDLPFEFIEQALKNRHKIIGSTRVNDAVVSGWNQEIIRKECEVCHKKITSELEVHHIKPRVEAVNGILQDGTHMNNARNLIVICQLCHDKVHSDKIIIGDVKITSDGAKRDIKRNDEIWSSSSSETSVQLKQTGDTSNENKKKCKWGDNELKTISDTLNKYTTLSLKSIRCHLEDEYDIKISETMLGKMRNKK